MRPHNLIYAAMFGLVASAFLIGCSVRLVPLDQPVDEGQDAYEKEEAMYEGYYLGGYGSSPSGFSYQTWQMSQYYRYADEPYYDGDPSGFRHLSSDRMTVDPNPNDSYYGGEKPVRRSPSQRSVEPIESRRQEAQHTRPRQSDTSFQRTVNRGRHTYPGLSSSGGRDDENNARQRLKHRRNQPDTKMTAEECAEHRRKVCQRARR